MLTLPRGGITIAWCARPEAVGWSPSAPAVRARAHCASIERFNRWATERYRIRLECLPGPFIGSPERHLALLNLNPGFSEADPEIHAHGEVTSLIRSNLVHETNAFYYFDPAFDETPGGAWWRRRLNPLVEAVGQGPVATGTPVVELFAYHSVRWKSCRAFPGLRGRARVTGPRSRRGRGCDASTPPLARRRSGAGPLSAAVHAEQRPERHRQSEELPERLDRIVNPLR